MFPSQLFWHRRWNADVNPLLQPSIICLFMRTRGKYAQTSSSGVKVEACPVCVIETVLKRFSMVRWPFSYNLSFLSRILEIWWSRSTNNTMLFNFSFTELHRVCDAWHSTYSCCLWKPNFKGPGYCLFNFEFQKNPSTTCGNYDHAA